MSTPVDKLGKEDILLRTRKFRIYPNFEQKKIYKEWMNTSRYVYNRALDSVKKSEDKINFYNLRNKYVTSLNNDLVKDWEIKTPKDVRAGSLRDLTKAYKTSFSNLKNGNISNFNINFRSKRNGYQSIEIPKTAISIKDNKLRIYSRYNKDVIKMSKEMKTKKNRNKNLEIKYDCRLKVNQYNEWYLCIPEERLKKKSNTTSKCALDPGVRKFQTLYSETEVKKLETNYELIKKLRKKIANYQILRSDKIIKKSQMSKKIRNLWKRFINLVDDMHFKLSNYLTKNYKEIFLPSFESQEMVKNINSTTRFNILNLQHYKFQTRLLDKCEETNNLLNICTEEYTSKTCTRCGTLNNVGSSEIYKCNNCKLIIDRDINGSRNIYLKCLVH